MLILPLKIYTPYEVIDYITTHKIPISETILMGDVPDSYTYINIE